MKYGAVLLTTTHRYFPDYFVEDRQPLVVQSTLPQSQYGKNTIPTFEFW